jgi:dTDP-glucose pyrophosphorylase
VEDVVTVGDRARVNRAVVLARGAGRRMRAADDGAPLSPAQEQAAASGHKALMPIAGRPFLDFVMTPLAHAGITDVALVVGPDHTAMRDAYPDDRGPGDLKLSWVVQEEPRGTANAVLAARAWAGDEPFLVLNGDNVYPEAAPRALLALDGPGLAGFAPDDLVATSNIASDRIAAFALLEQDAAGHLEAIVEKPGAADLARVGANALVSMNLWRFDARIFDACRDVASSPRGEFELPAAAMLARSRGVEFTVVRARGPVLDLSRRADVADVTRRLLGGVTPA